MKFKEAMDIINKKENEGFMVGFEWVKGGLRSDHFPDKRAGEDLIKTEVEAWDLAKQFAEKTYSKCVNIYVINANFSPVENYRDQLIINRTL